MQYKLKHRLSAALMAGAMCCTMIPAASADEIATPETAEAAVTEDSNEVEPSVTSDGGLSVEEIQSRMYPSLPQTATLWQKPKAAIMSQRLPPTSIKTTSRVLIKKLITAMTWHLQVWIKKAFVLTCGAVT